jgi:methylmalonyl-CoA mutase cobalamin-binding domain/chain
VIDKLRKNGQGDVLVFLGGIIPEQDIQSLLTAGVKAVYGPGTNTQKVCEDIKTAMADRNR